MFICVLCTFFKKKNTYSKKVTTNFNFQCLKTLQKIIVFHSKNNRYLFKKKVEKCIEVKAKSKRFP